MLEDMLKPEYPDSKFAPAIEEMGAITGYHTLMKSASASWAKKHPGKNRVLGPHQTLVTALLSKVQAALQSSTQK